MTSSRLPSPDSGAEAAATAPVTGAEGVNIVQAPEDDDDNYTDRAYLLDAPAWVVHGTQMAQR